MGVVAQGAVAMTGEIHELPGASAPPPSPASNGGGGNGRDLHGRVSALEAHLQHLATKEDIRRIETLIAQREAAMLRWLIGLVLASALGLGVALVRVFVG